MDTFRTKLPTPFDFPDVSTALAILFITYGGPGILKPYVPLAGLITIFGKGLVIIRSDFYVRLDERALTRLPRIRIILQFMIASLQDFDAYFAPGESWAVRTHPELTNRPIAYFSMEYGLHETLPIYSGGLGVLAGDHLKEASDLGLPLVGMGLMYAEGIFLSADQ